MNRRPVLKKWKADNVLFWISAGTPWGLAILLLGVSMPHLADGFQRICHCSAMAGWLLAVAVDCAQVAAKLQLTIGQSYNLAVSARKTSIGIIVATSAMSAMLNVLAFLEGSDTLTGDFLAVVMGIMIPALILALSYTGSCFALTKKKVVKRKGKK